MRVVVAEEEAISIPNWVRDLASFRHWAVSDNFPETARISYLNDHISVDRRMEQLFWHTRVKAEYTYVLVGLEKSEKRGIFLPDGAQLTHILANFSHIPDGIFVLQESLRSERVSLIEGKRGGFVELEGTPDMVLEILSDSSVKKDTVTLRELYWKAGIREYWLVDVRRDNLRFDILRHTEEGYSATRKPGGWVKSAVFGKAFKLTAEKDDLGHPEYTLAVR